MVGECKVIATTLSAVSRIQRYMNRIDNTDRPYLSVLQVDDGATGFRERSMFVTMVSYMV